MDRLRAAAALAALAIVLPAAAQPQSFKAELEPGAMHEECMRVEKGVKRDYSWKSDVPVDFNIHYHHEPEVFYPVKREAMRGDGGTFIAKTGEDYCWMWTARDRKAKVEGRIDPAPDPLSRR
ncbi:MAG TPA: hypothetical protein VH301_00295 [Usitatibacter sp.]|jgi:hypothetical protein|nr:hypothetical protein [Usitatibacter sp.]